MSDLIPRRNFLSQATAATVVGCCGTWAHAENQSASLLTMEPDDIQRFVGSAFKISGETQSFTANLVEVVETKNYCPPPHLSRKRAFTLVFRPTNGNRVTDGHYVCSHPTLGKSTLFLLPFGGGVCFQSCVS